MDDKEILRKVSDTVLEEAVTFEMDVSPGNKWQAFLQRMGWAKSKREFEIKPLTLAQLQRISKLLLAVDINNLTTDAILTLMTDHSYTCAKIIAIAVSPSRQKPTKALVDVFFNNLSKNDLELALQIVLGQMNVESFMYSIASIRSLNILQTRKNVNAKPVKRNEVNPTEQGSQIAPGSLYAAS